ncbi:MAG: TPM domain-containing protein, partial [Elusimicrobia bacterium]|nr:TPM domain-containing protein [Elusimicrobiota bacterium]
MRRLALAVLAAAAFAAPSLALDVPYLTGRVNDEAHLLDANAARDLDATLKGYEAKTGRQLVVLTLPSLDGDALEDFSIKVARAWKLGRKGQDDGILILVVRDDRKIRIEVGYGLEGTLPDILCGRIIRDEMTPRFRNGDYAGGIKAAVDAVTGVLNGTYSPPPDPVTSDSGVGDMPLSQKILMSVFVFGILGIFEFVGVL